MTLQINNIKQNILKSGYDFLKNDLKSFKEEFKNFEKFQERHDALSNKFFGLSKSRDLQSLNDVRFKK